MTRMIFVRHGESTGNLKRIFYGHTDGELTDFGRLQAERARDYLRGFHIDAAYASDLSRAYETGKIILEPHNIELVGNEKLREIYAGEWENMLFDDIEVKFNAEYEKFRQNSWYSHPEGGESVEEMTYRIRDEVWRIAKAHDNETVFIAFHSTPLRSLACEWNNVPYSKMNEQGWIGNASVSIVEYDIENHTTKPELIGYNDFLNDLTKE